MLERADAGDIVDQLAVPILEDDEAREVFAKVTVAAETILARSLPALIEGRAPRRPQPLEPQQYFGRRRPEDGRIDWRWPARQIHDLVRAVAPPFPGAFAQVGAQRWQIQRTRLTGERAAHGTVPRLYAEHGECRIVCGDGAILRLLATADARGPLDLQTLAASLAQQPLALS
jgi:methionyl-tRNA formyltransferase